MVNDGGYLGRASTKEDSGKYTYKISPFYKDNNYFGWDKKYIPWNLDGDPKKRFKTPSLTEEILGMFKFRVRTR